jgi:hypothetical protein
LWKAQNAFEKILKEYLLLKNIILSNIFIYSDIIVRIASGYKCKVTGE